MKFNKLAKEQNLSVAELADIVKDILPNANGGTEVSDEQRASILTRLAQPTAASPVLTDDSQDLILAALQSLIAEESQLETPEVIVSEMIERYLADPADLPDDPSYREAIITYVELVKKRHARKQQQSYRLRSLLNGQMRAPFAAEPLALETFYSSGPSASSNSATLSGNGKAPQLSAASSSPATS